MVLPSPRYIHCLVQHRAAQLLWPNMGNTRHACCNEDCWQRGFQWCSSLHPQRWRTLCAALAQSCVSGGRGGAPFHFPTYPTSPIQCLVWHQVGVVQGFPNRCKDSQGGFWQCSYSPPPRSLCSSEGKPCTVTFQPQELGSVAMHHIVYLGSGVVLKR